MKKVFAKETEIEVSAMTDTGMVRDHNEDNFIVCPDLAKKDWFFIDKPVPLSSKGGLFVVADGMGGANAGEVASSIAVEAIKAFFLDIEIPEGISDDKAKGILERSITYTHKEIVQHAIHNPSCEGMGTTVVIAWIIANKVLLGWCGDSRGYVFDESKEVKKITSDHSLVWELVKAGKISPEEADFHPQNNIITQSLGDPSNTPTPEVLVHQLNNGDRILLCSDGLNNMLSIREIEEILFASNSLGKNNKELIAAANKKGGKDNITSIIISYQSTGNTTLGSRKKKSKVLISLMFVIVAALVASGLLFLTLEKDKNTEFKVSLKKTPSAPEISETPIAVVEKPAKVERKKLIKVEPEKAVVIDTLSVAKGRDSIRNEVNKRIELISSIESSYQKISPELAKSEGFTETPNEERAKLIVDIERSAEDFKKVQEQLDKQLTLLRREFEKHDESDLDIEEIDKNIAKASQQLTALENAIRKVKEITHP